MAARQSASGCLFGSAFGDALGADTEFLDVGSILSRYPPGGPRTLRGTPIRVTDDTQMALAVGRALLRAEQRYTPEALEPLLRQEFVAWNNSPDNNRAPGNTCLTACRRLEKGEPWHKATVAGSKGCGANMRVAPVGLLNVDEQTRAAVAQFQAALTHGHPTALAAADLTACAVAYLVQGGQPDELVHYLSAYATANREVYHHDWLGPLWQRPYTSTPTEFIARGWDECLVVLNRLEASLRTPAYDQDPCLATGAGWVAEEALATGLFCFLLYPNSPIDAISRAATSSGDSDSIACLTGAFVGAALGLGVWPSDWIERIEYHDALEMLGAAWDTN